MHVSIAVFPAPITVKRPAGSARSTRSLGGTSVTPVVDRESRNVPRRDLRLDVGGVDDLAPRPDDGLGAVEQRYDEVPVTVHAVLAHAEEPHPPRRQQVLVEHARVVVADLGRTRALVEAGVRAALVDAIVPERPSTRRRSTPRAGGAARTDRRRASGRPARAAGRPARPRRRSWRPGCRRTPSPTHRLPRRGSRSRSLAPPEGYDSRALPRGSRVARALAVTVR